MPSIKTTKTNPSFFFYCLIIAIIATGFFFRIWQLDSIPPGIWYDEAYNGLDAITALENNDYKMFYPENNGREGLYINLLAISFKFLGTNNFSLHLPGAIMGALTVLGLFLLLKELRFSRLTILLATFMIAFSFWHINFSRIAFRGIMVPFLTVWIFYFFFKGFFCTKKHGIPQTYRALVYFALSGALTGLGFHTYISFRIFPLILIGLLITMWIVTKDFFKLYWQEILVFIFSAFLVALPLFVHFYHHPTDFSGRSNSVSIFNAPDMTFAQALSKSLTFHLGSFFFAGDPNQRHNHNVMSLIPIAWSVLFGLGFFISIREIISSIIGRFRGTKTARFFHAALLAQLIFWVMIVPGVLSIEGIPHALRIIGTIPAVFMISVLAIEYMLKTYSTLKNSPRRELKPWRWQIMRFSFFGLLLVIILSGFSQAYLYFEVWAKDPKTAFSFEKKYYDLGKIIKQTPTKENNFLIVSPEIGISEDRKSSALKTVEFTGYPQIKNYLFYKPFEALTMIPCKNSQIIFQQSDSWLRQQFAEKCPNLSFEKITTHNKTGAYWLLK